MAGWFFGPILEKIRSSCFDYLEDQLVLHTDMKEALERLQKLHPKIQSVIFACNQDQIIDPALNRWLWQLRDAIDEADDVLDDFEYMKHEEQLTKNNDETKLLPNIPASPEVLNLSDLEALQCLPSSLSTSSLKRLHLTRIPLLKSLPDLPPGLKSLSVHNCHRKLMKQYQSFHRL